MMPLDSPDRRSERFVPMGTTLSAFDLCPRGKATDGRPVEVVTAAVSAVFDRQTSTLTWKGGAYELHGGMVGAPVTFTSAAVFFRSYAYGACVPGEVVSEAGGGTVIEGRAVLTPPQVDGLLNGNLGIQVATSGHPNGVVGGRLEVRSQLDKREVKFYSKGFPTGADIYGTVDTATKTLELLVEADKGSAAGVPLDAVYVHEGRTVGPTAARAHIVSSEIGQYRRHDQGKHPPHRRSGEGTVRRAVARDCEPCR